jgi:hypothetical protein
MAAIFTIFEASLSGEDWPALHAAWNDTSANRPEQAARAWLVRDLDNPDTWCAVTLWSSREALNDYQETADLLPANLMFRSLGADPLLAAFQVIEEG